MTDILKANNDTYIGEGAALALDEIGRDLAEALNQQEADALYRKHLPEIMEIFKDTIDDLGKK